MNGTELLALVRHHRGGDETDGDTATQLIGALGLLWVELPADDHAAIYNRLSALYDLVHTFWWSQLTRKQRLEALMDVTDPGSERHKALMAQLRGLPS